MFSSTCKARGVAGGLHGGGAVQQRGQQAQQIFQTSTHHHLMGTALHAAVFGQIIRQRLPQGKVTLGVAVGQQLRGGVQQFLLQPRPGAEGKQPRVHAPGGQVVPHRRFRRGGLRHGRGRRRAPCIRPDLRQRQIFLYIKAAAFPGGKVALGSQHLVGGVHSVYRDRQFRRQPPLAGHPGAGGQGPGAHLSGQTAVQLFVQRHPGARLQCGGQMDHDRVLLFFAECQTGPIKNFVLGIFMRSVPRIIEHTRRTPKCQVGWWVRGRVSDQNSGGALKRKSPAMLKFGGKAIMSTTAMWLLLAVVVVAIVFGSVLYKRTFTTKELALTGVMAALSLVAYLFSGCRSTAAPRSIWATPSRP